MVHLLLAQYSAFLATALHLHLRLPPQQQQCWSRPEVNTHVFVICIFIVQKCKSVFISFFSKPLFFETYLGFPWRKCINHFCHLRAAQEEYGQDQEDQGSFDREHAYENLFHYLYQVPWILLTSIRDWVSKSFLFNEITPIVTYFRSAQNVLCKHPDFRAEQLLT